jgi:hypothetical protein
LAETLSRLDHVWLKDNSTKGLFMKANVQVDVQATTPSDAQRILLAVSKKLKSDGFITEFHFEIDTPDGVITEKSDLGNELIYPNP